MSLRSLIVGIGNPLQGCDGFGPAVLEHLRTDTDLPDGIGLLDAGTDLLSCLDHAAEFDRVVLVDAFLGAGCGGVVTVDETTFSRWSSESPTSHEFSAALAIALFRRLHPHAVTRVVLIGLDCGRVSSGDRLSPSLIEAGVRAALEECTGSTAAGGASTT